MSQPRPGSKPRPGWSTRAKHRLEYAVARPLLGLLSHLPESSLPTLGGGLGRLAYRLDRKHRTVAMDNLRLALPELSDARRDQIVRQSFRYLALNPLIAFSAWGRSRERLLERYVGEGWHHLEEAQALGRGVLFMSAHFGLWAAAEQYPALRGRPLAILHRPVNNPLLERQIQRLRGHLGNRSINKRAGTREILKTLRQGGRVAIMMDQRVHPNEGKAYRFFGHPAYTSPLPAMLSLRTGAPVVPGFSYPLDDGLRCKVVFQPAIHPEGEGTEAIERLTLRYLRVVEEVIRQRPELWLWMHRRWRKNPTHFPKRRIPATAAGPDSTEVVG